jgi:hypothetical protein
MSAGKATATGQGGPPAAQLPTGTAPAAAASTARSARGAGRRGGEGLNPGPFLARHQRLARDLQGQATPTPARRWPRGAPRTPGRRRPDGARGRADDGRASAVATIVTPRKPIEDVKPQAMTRQLIHTRQVPRCRRGRDPGSRDRAGGCSLHSPARPGPGAGGPPPTGPGPVTQLSGTGLRNASHTAACGNQPQVRRLSHRPGCGRPAARTSA